MNWIKINGFRFNLARIVQYDYDPNDKMLHVQYFTGINLEYHDIKYHAIHHTERLDNIFKLERNNNAKVSKADVRVIAAASR